MAAGEVDGDVRFIALLVTEPVEKDHTCGRASTMAVDIVGVEGAAPDLRSILLRELAPLLHPPGPAPKVRWISLGVPGPDGKPRGGLIGVAAGPWLTIDLFWLPEDLRGVGKGSALLASAERLAFAFGCRSATVTTTSAGASNFYQRNGYMLRLCLPEIRPGLTQFTLLKETL